MGIKDSGGDATKKGNLNFLFGGGRIYSLDSSIKIGKQSKKGEKRARLRKIWEKSRPKIERKVRRREKQLTLKRSWGCISVPFFWVTGE